MSEEIDNKDANVKSMKGNIKSRSALAISFDTTGSMSSCIKQVRSDIKSLVESMREDIEDLKIALIAHGDYCDGDNCIAFLDFTDDLEKIMKFINEVPNTSGGDAPECYELSMQTANSLSWPKEGGTFIIIGDELPHEDNPNKINWREELKSLAQKNVKVIPMQCLYAEYSKERNAFWNEIAEISETPLLKLESFSDSSGFMEAAAYASSGSENYGKYLFKSAARGDSVSTNFAENRVKLEAFANSKE